MAKFKLIVFHKPKEFRGYHLFRRKTLNNSAEENTERSRIEDERIVKSIDNRLGNSNIFTNVGVSRTRTKPKKRKEMVGGWGAGA